MTIPLRARCAAGAALAAALACLPGVAPAQSGCGASYTVQPGDTLAAIAERCGTTVEALAGANAVVANPGQISVGWELTVPGARASLGPDSEVRPPTRSAAAEAVVADGAYEVRPGDSFASIATALQIPMRALMAANAGVDPFGLRPGQTLQLPSAAAAEPEGDPSGSAPGADGLPPRKTGDPGEAKAGLAGPPEEASERGQAQPGAEPEEVSAERLLLEGRVASGTECPILETPEGEVYSLVSAEYGFMPGEYVEIEGEAVEMSFCLEGKATVRVTSMSAVAAPQGG